MAYRSSTTANGTTSPAVGTLPAGTTTHDRLYAFVVVDNGSMSQICAPPGWEAIGFVRNPSGKPDGQYGQLFEVKDYKGDEGLAFHFTGTTPKWMVQIVSLSGLENFGPANVTGTVNTTSNTTPVSVSLSGTNVDYTGDQVIVFCQLDQTVQADTWSFSTATGFTKQQDSSPGIFITVTTQTLDSGTLGDTGSIALTATRSTGTGNAGYGGFVLSVRKLGDVQFSSHPATQTAIKNNTVTLSVTATGTGSLTYQWQEFSSGSWANISGATSSSYSFIASSSNKYRVSVTSASETRVSDIAIVSVSVPVYVQLKRKIKKRSGIYDISGKGWFDKSFLTNGIFDKDVIVLAASYTPTNTSGVARNIQRLKSATVTGKSSTAGKTRAGERIKSATSTSRLGTLSGITRANNRLKGSVTGKTSVAGKLRTTERMVSATVTGKISTSGKIRTTERNNPSTLTLKTAIAGIVKGLERIKSATVTGKVNTTGSVKQKSRLFGLANIISAVTISTAGVVRQYNRLSGLVTGKITTQGEARESARIQSATVAGKTSVSGKTKTIGRLKGSITGKTNTFGVIREIERLKGISTGKIQITGLIKGLERLKGLSTGKTSTSGKIKTEQRIKPATILGKIATIGKIVDSARIKSATVTGKISTSASKIYQSSRLYGVISASINLLHTVGVIRAFAELKGATVTSKISLSGKVRAEQVIKSATVSSKIAVAAAKIQQIQRAFGLTTGKIQVAGQIKETTKTYGSIVSKITTSGLVRSSEKVKSATSSLKIAVSGKIASIQRIKYIEAVTISMSGVIRGTQRFLGQTSIAVQNLLADKGYGIKHGEKGFSLSKKIKGFVLGKPDDF